MIRINIKWDFISPSLRVISGILTVENFASDATSKGEVLLRCRVKKESGTLGYSSIDDKGKGGIPHYLFEALRPQINTMVRSYYDGVLLKDFQYDWVENPNNLSFDEWLTSNGVSRKKGGNGYIYSKTKNSKLDP